MVQTETKNNINPILTFTLKEGSASIKCEGNLNAVVISTTLNSVVQLNTFELTYEDTLKLAFKFLTIPAISKLYPHAALPSEVGSGKIKNHKDTLSNYRGKYIDEFGEKDQFGSSNIIRLLKRGSEPVLWGDFSVEYTKATDSFKFTSGSPISLTLLTDVFVSIVSDIETKRYFPHFSAGYLRRWGEECFQGYNLKKEIPEILTAKVKLKPQEDEEIEITQTPKANNELTSASFNQALPAAKVLPAPEPNSELLAELQREKAQFSERSASLNKGFQQLAQEKTALQTERNTLAEERTTLDNMRIALRDEKSDLESERSRLKLSAITQANTAKQTLEAELQKATQALQAHTRNQEQSAAELALLTKEYEDLENQKALVLKAQTEIEAEQIKLKADYQALETERLSIQKARKEVDQMSDSQLTEFEKREVEINAKKLELEEIERRISALLSSGIINSGKNGNSNHAQAEIIK